MTHRNNMYPNPTGLTNNYYNTNPYQTHMNAHPKVNNREAVVSKNRDTSDIERELFVGDLSFFCRAHHLEDLFNQYGTVLSARIQLSEKKSRHSLMYGFVKMESADQAKNAITALNGILFMGRTMRLQQCNAEGKPFPFLPKIGYQIHVSFITRRIADLLIDEEYLRSLFARFGDIIDAVICRHYVQENIPKQAGYGFVYYLTEEAAKSAIEVMGHYDQDGVVFDSFISHRSSGAEQNKQPHQNQHQHHQPKDHQKPPSPNSSLAQSSYLANDAMAGQHSFFSGQHAPNGLGLENPGIDAMYTARSEASTHSATIHSTESVSSEASSSNNSMKLGNNSPIGVNETPKMMVMAAPPPSAGKKSLKPTIESDRDHIDPMMGMQRSRFPQGNGYDGMESFRPPATYPSRRNQNDLSFPAFPFHQQQPQMGDNLNYMYNRDPYGAPHTNPFLANANGYGKLQPELYYGGGGDGMHSNHHFTRNERMGGHHHQNQHHHQQQSFHHRSNITQQMMNQEQFQYHDSHQMHGQFRGPTPDHRYTPQQYDPRPHLSHSPANNSYHSSMPPSLHQQHTSQLPSQLPSQLSSAQLSQTFSQPSSIDDLRSEFFPQPESRWNHLSATSQFNFEQQRTTSNLALSKSPGHRQSSLPTSDFTLESSNKALFDREPSESLLESFDYLKISSSASKTHDLHAVSALSSNLLSASPSTFLSQLHSNTNSLNATLDSTNSILGNISMTDITQNRFDGLSTGDNYTPF